MAQIAVDVVLLPSDEMMDIAIEANKGLLKQTTDNIVLNKENCLPHLSLAMGAVDESDIEDIESILKEIKRKFSLGLFIATGFSISTDLLNNTISVLQIERTDELQSLHETVMLKLKSYFYYNITKKMMFSAKTVSPSTMRWIKEYPQKSSYANFSPHITVGYGRAGGLTFPIEFSVSKLALCHLGNHCTCRKVLWSGCIDF